LAADQDPGRLQPFEPLGQRIGADSGQIGADVTKPFWTEHKLAHHQQGPALPDQVERVGGSAGVVIAPPRRAVLRIGYFS